MDKVYLETTVVSYLVSDPSRDLIVAGHQAVTHEWWDSQRPSFDCFISAVVLEEIQQGDSRMAAKRLATIAGLPVLEIAEATAELIRKITAAGIFPPKATRDIAHVAVATTGCVDYLLTWNCRHIANAKIESRLRAICETADSACRPFVLRKNSWARKRKERTDMPDDPLVREVRRVRNELASKFDYDAEAIIRDLIARQGEISNGHVMVKNAGEPLPTGSTVERVSER